MLKSGAPPSGSLYRDALQALKKDRAAMIGLVVIVALAAIRRPSSRAGWSMGKICFRHLRLILRT